MAAYSGEETIAILQHGDEVATANLQTGSVEVDVEHPLLDRLLSRVVVDAAPIYTIVPLDTETPPAAIRSTAEAELSSHERVAYLRDALDGLDFELEVVADA